MGYAQVVPYQQLTVKSGTINSITLTNVATTYSIATVYLPSFSMPLSHAYIDIHVTGISETSGALNYLQGAGDTTIHDSGGTDRKIGDCNIGDLRCNASVYAPVHYIIPGNYDVKNYLSSGMDVHCYLYDVDCHANNLILYGVYAEANLYFGL